MADEKSINKSIFSKILGDRILLRKIDDNSNGIHYNLKITPNMRWENADTGEVIMIGAGENSEKKEKCCALQHLKIGDKIIYEKYSGNISKYINSEGHQFIIIQASHIIGILNNE